MQLLIDHVAVAVAVFENQVTIEPIAPHSIHAVTFARCHQIFGEEASQMPYGADECAAENVVGIADGHSLVWDAVNHIGFHFINAGDEAFRTHFDFPFVAYLGAEVVQQGEVL